MGICPHLGCSPSDRFTPGPQPSLPNDWEGGFLCPCHGSLFSAEDGAVITGPATTGLAPVDISVVDDQVVLG